MNVKEKMMWKVFLITDFLISPFQCLIVWLFNVMLTVWLSTLYCCIFSYFQFPFRKCLVLVGKENHNHNQDSNKEDLWHQINMQKFKTGLFEYLLKYFQLLFFKICFLLKHVSTKTKQSEKLMSIFIISLTVQIISPC